MIDYAGSCSLELGPLLRGWDMRVSCRAFSKWGQLSCIICAFQSQTRTAKAYAYKNRTMKAQVEWPKRGLQKPKLTKTELRKLQRNNQRHCKGADPLRKWNVPPGHADVSTCVATVAVANDIGTGFRAQNCKVSLPKIVQSNINFDL